MTLSTTPPLDAFQWAPQPAPFQFVRAVAEALLAANPAARQLAERMRDQTGTRFLDWIDHIRLPVNHPLAEQLAGVGYRAETRQGGCAVWVNESGVFPPVLVADGTTIEIALKVESVADFAAVHGIDGEVEGPPLGLYRRLGVSESDGTRLSVVERHGYRGFTVPPFEPDRAIARLAHLECFRTRRRDFPSDADGFTRAARLIDAAVAELGADVACDAFFAAEREVWQRRNRAAQVQKARQDKLGLGWANHDHHTYRSSRAHFKSLIAIWEKLGLRCRERFYAGREAGWGAQVMEQPVTGIITFNDVDLTPDELMGDFSHDGLAEQSHLGTVGLWCALHGDSFLQAGMHHLEAMFDFDSLKAQLEREDVRTMKPFTNFAYLRQAFTEGERWEVHPKRIERLLRTKRITPMQAEQFRTQGAIGSHLENLERNDGFKGFNQTGVSEIVSATDPRKQLQK